MWEYITDRAIKEGEYIIENLSTVRATAQRFGISKSTVHKDVTERLQHIDVDLHERVQKVLVVNLKERHLRGGNATKKKFERLHRAAEERKDG